MIFEWAEDLELVRTVITHARLYDAISDDFSPSREDYRPPVSPAIRYLLVRDGGEFLGLWMCVAHSEIVLEVHTCLLPRAWGRRAAIAARECAEWLWRHTKAQRIITAAPSCNPLAIAFAKRAGMEQYGRNPRAYQKRGELHDVVLLGISRPEKEEQSCQQQH